MRLFIAIQFSEDIRTSLAEVQDNLSRQGVRGNCTASENLHLTLAFIGEYSDPDHVLEAMNAVSFSPFSLKLDGFGCFGDLLWAGLSESRPLDAVVRRLRRSLSGAGIPYDRKRFSPHITLIRRAAYPGSGKFPAVRIPPSEMTVRRISLMRSDRGKRGMIYTELGSVEALPELPD